MAGQRKGAGDRLRAGGSSARGPMRSGPSTHPHAERGGRVAGMVVVVAAHQGQVQRRMAPAPVPAARPSWPAAWARAECSRSPRKTMPRAPVAAISASSRPAPRRWWPRAPARRAGGTTPPCRGGRRPPAAGAASGGRRRPSAATAAGGRRRRAANQAVPSSRPVPAGCAGISRQSQQQRVQVLGGRAPETRAGVALQPADDQRGQRRGQRDAVHRRRGRAVGIGGGAQALAQLRFEAVEELVHARRSGARARTPAHRRPSPAPCRGSSRRTAAAPRRCGAPAARRWPRVR